MTSLDRADQLSAPRAVFGKQAYLACFALF